jgi:hypothetical protein
MLITKDGNPNSARHVDSYGKRSGSHFPLRVAKFAWFWLLCCKYPFGVNIFKIYLIWIHIHTNLGGGVKFFKFPYEEIQEYTFNVQQYTKYLCICNENIHFFNICSDIILN